MEIRFSGAPKRMANIPAQFNPTPVNLVTWAVRNAAVDPLSCHVSSYKGKRVRFVVHKYRSAQKASVEDHDRVIRALLTLDPDATVRTARAIYEGLRDFESQVNARTQEV